jgi:cyanophycin synthetase
VHLLSTAGELPGLDLAGLLARRGLADEATAEALLAATAAAWAFGISPELIAAGIETFEFKAPA